MCVLITIHYVNRNLRRAHAPPPPVEHAKGGIKLTPLLPVHTDRHRHTHTQTHTHTHTPTQTQTQTQTGQCRDENHRKMWDQKISRFQNRSIFKIEVPIITGTVVTCHRRVYYG